MLLGNGGETSRDRDRSRHGGPQKGKKRRDLSPRIISLSLFSSFLLLSSNPHLLRSGVALALQDDIVAGLRWIESRFIVEKREGKCFAFLPEKENSTPLANLLIFSKTKLLTSSRPLSMPPHPEKSEAIRNLRPGGDMGGMKIAKRRKELRFGRAIEKKANERKNKKQKRLLLRC